MRLTLWSLAYLLPLAAYCWVSVVRGRSLLNPMVVGGTFLLAMFLLEGSYHQTLSAGYLLALHLACAAAYWLGGGVGYRLAGRVRRRARNNALVVRPRTWLVAMLAALAVALFIFVVSYESSVTVLMEMRNRNDLRLGSISMQVGMLERVALYLRGYLAPLATLGILLWCRRARPTPASLALLAVTLGVWGLVALGGGSRGAIVFMLIQCVFAIHYAKGRSSRIRLAPRVIVALLVPLGAAAILAQTLYRNTGLPVGHAVADLQTRAGEAGDAIVRHLSFNDEVAFVLASYPDFYPYTEGHSLYTPLVVLVPRSWWPAKPVPWGRTLAWQYGFEYYTTISLAATVPGEGYANFGLAGWTLFPLGFGLVIGWAHHRLQHARDEFDMTVGLWGLFWALSLRGDVHSAMVSIILPYLVVMIAFRLLAFRRRAPAAVAGALLHWKLGAAGGLAAAGGLESEA